MKEDKEKSIDNSNQPHFAESPYRFIIIFLFSTLSFCNGMQWVTYSSVGSEFQIHYNIDVYGLNLFSSLYMIAYPILAFPSSLLIEKSMKINVIGASILTLMGAILKYNTNYSLFIAYFGQGLSAIAQPFILNCQVKLAALWFRAERVKPI